MVHLKCFVPGIRKVHLETIVFQVNHVKFRGFFGFIKFENTVQTYRVFQQQICEFGGFDKKNYPQSGDNNQQIRVCFFSPLVPESFEHNTMNGVINGLKL